MASNQPPNKPNHGRSNKGQHSSASKDQLVTSKALQKILPAGLPIIDVTSGSDIIQIRDAIQTYCQKGNWTYLGYIQWWQIRRKKGHSQGYRKNYSEYTSDSISKLKIHSNWDPYMCSQRTTTLSDYTVNYLSRGSRKFLSTVGCHIIRFQAVIFYIMVGWQFRIFFICRKDCYILHKAASP